MTKQLLLVVMLLLLAVFNTHAQTEAFITTWHTGDDGYIVIPTKDTYTYNYHIVVADAETKTILSERDANGTVSISGLPGFTYVTVSITGTFPAISMISMSLMRPKLMSIDQWGTIEWQSMNGAFYGCSLLYYRATDTPDLSKVTDLGNMFTDVSGFNSNLNSWDVSNVTNMASMFWGASSFNGDISGWDVSNVTSMRSMFTEASKFNGDISDWDVSNVTDMSYMFSQATAFNGDLNNWDVSKVTEMNFMFYKASSFNQDLSDWDVSNVTSMYNMFNGASSFNGAMTAWNVSKVTTFSSMFFNASSFNQDLSTWNANVNADVGYMLYKSNATYYTITYNEDGTEYLGFYPYGHADITLRTLDAKDGVPFYGWNTASDFSGESLIYIEEGVTGNLTLYADWSTSTSATTHKASSIRCYPNPVINQINIEGLEGDYSYGAVYNSAGVMMTQFDLQFNQETYQIQMSDYASGIYLLQLQKSDGNTESFKLIKK